MSRGVTRGRLRGSDLAAPYPGVRRPSSVAGHPITDYLPRMRSGQYFSGVTAALIHDLYLPWRLERAVTPLHVTAISPRRAPRTAGVVGHQAEPGRLRVERVRGVPVVSAVDTWCQLASELSLEALVVMGDGLVRRQDPVATLTQLTEAVARFTGAPGCGTLREALALVRPRTDSPRETRLRLLIRAAGLPEPVVNYPILDRFGNFLAYGDLAYPKEKVLVEYDGAHHFESPEQGLNDVDRLEPIMAEGWRIIHVTKRHVSDVRSPRIRAIREALIERGWRPPS